ncbi:MAG TPA: hypothetical protein VNN73_18740, partial [Blastocatellia bacterium]|nr:hypothetical protein [Blastocatellia bacterium]
MAGKISNKVSRAIQLLIMASIAIMLSTAKAAAQNAFDKGTPAESKGGMSGLSTYAQDKVETVNLANGNLNVHIPLVTIGGRGSASYTVALNYNSKLWSGQHNLELRQDAFDQTVLIKVHHFGATFDNLLGNTPNTLFLGAGWSILKGPAIKVQRVDIDPVDCSNVRGDTLYKYVLTKVWVVLPDGSEIEMRDDVSDGAPYLIPNVCDPNNRADRYRGRVWHSTDGSAMTYITDVDDGVVTGQLGGYVYLADGTRMRMTMPQLSGSARCTKIIDPNGNVLDINYNKVFEQSGVQGAVTYRDQLGRQVAVQSTPDGMSVTIRGYNNEVADRVINVRTGLIAPDDNTLAAPNLREDFRDTVAWPRPFISGDYSNTTAGVEEHSVYGTSPHKDLFPPSDVDVGMAKISGELDQQGNPVDGLFVVTRLDLLDGRSFKFRYNPYGELAEIEYPGGGISKINYAPAPEGSGMCEAGGPIKALLKRRVVERRTFSDGSTADTVWSYSWTRPPAPDFPTVTVQARQASTNALLMDETHYFLALDAEYRTCVPSTGATMLSGNIKWENAKEFKVERRTGTGTQTETRNWTQRAAQSWGNDPNSSVNAY